MEYRIKLPEHDFMVAFGRKLTRSVIVIEWTCNWIKKTESCSHIFRTHLHWYTEWKIRLIYCGYTCHWLRHLYVDIHQFKSLAHWSDGTVKSFLILLVDSGPEENPRYEETIKYACENLSKLQLDALHISTNAPGRSAYNPVKRRMDPFGRFLSGIILPNEIFGSHLNSKEETVYDDLEKRNFQ